MYGYHIVLDITCQYKMVILPPGSCFWGVFFRIFGVFSDFFGVIFQIFWCIFPIFWVFFRILNPVSDYGSEWKWLKEPERKRSQMFSVLLYVLSAEQFFSPTSQWIPGAYSDRPKGTRWDSQNTQKNWFLWLSKWKPSIIWKIFRQTSSSSSFRFRVMADGR